MPIALSWSRISDWDQCPRKFYLKHVARGFPKEDISKSVHLVKGAEIHKQLENFVYAKLNKKPVEEVPMVQSAKSTIPLIERVMGQFSDVWPERQVAVTYDFKPAEWFGADVGFRSIWDFSGLNTGHALILDWKTGKVYDYEDECGQLHLSGAMGNAIFGADVVDIAYVYVEQKIMKPETPLRLEADDFPHIRAFFQKVYDIVNVEKDWAPRANQYCNWCPATKLQCPLSRKP